MTVFSPLIQLKLELSHWKFLLQRHLLFPSPVSLQDEFGQSLQSSEEEQVGCSGGSQDISTSLVPVNGSASHQPVTLKGDDRSSCKNLPPELPPSQLSPSLVWMTNFRVSGLILVIL